MDIPWAGLGGVGLLIAALLCAGVLVRVQRWRLRRRASLLPAGVSAVREARDAPGRLFVEASLVGGPRAGGYSTIRADLVLAPGLLIVATHQGRMLQVDATHPGKALCTGPRRLVLEGLHPSGSTRVRLELMVDDAEGWAEAAQALAPA